MVPTPATMCYQDLEPLAACSGSTRLAAEFHANFEVVLADSPRQIRQAMALRYQVYCLERDYESPDDNPSGYEQDEYDERSVHAFVRHRDSDCCVGAVRLVLADREDAGRRFPIETICATRFHTEASWRIGAVPRTRLAEISRFSVSKVFRRRYEEAQYVDGLSPRASYADSGACAWIGRRAVPQITMGLFAAIVKLSKRHDVTHWYAVMEPRLLRLLQQFGIHFSPFGPAVDHHGLRRPCFAIGSQLAARTRQERPDVWSLVTSEGRDVPPGNQSPALTSAR
jgi:N-acyl amino acid synthase of PEP-CTERM/exosortase system